MKQCFRLVTVAAALAFVASPPQLGRGDAGVPVVRVSATLTRATERAGRLSVTADIAKGFPIYAQSQRRPCAALTRRASGRNDPLRRW